MNELANIRELSRRWKRDGVKLLPPHDEKKVVRELSRLGRPFARDVVSLYCSTGGMEDAEMDEAMLSLWTLDRTVTENLNQPRPQLLFMDFLLNSHCYGLQYEGSDVSSVYIDHFVSEPPQRVADSLNEFFQLYLNEPSKLFL